MLQQTQVDRVIPKWLAWLEQVPTLTALAEAQRADVIRAWSGLGYNVRAVRLHEIAREAVERFGGSLPPTVDLLMELKGIGRYTAGAVACFGFGLAAPMVDTNVRRVLGRIFLGEPLMPVTRTKEAERLAETVLPLDRAYPWNQALMDLGATVCTATRPACLLCPLLGLCKAAPTMSAWPEERQRELRESRAVYGAKGSKTARQRFFRGQIVDALRAVPTGDWVAFGAIRAGVAPDFDEADSLWLRELAERLVRDGLLEGRAEPEAGFRLAH